jgi:hypothetical protein
MRQWMVGFFSDQMVSILLMISYPAELTNCGGVFGSGG